VLQRIREELREVGGDAGVGSARVGALEYLDATVREALRHDTIIPIVVRRLKRPLRIGGVDLPEGVIAAPALLLTHHRKDVWGDPEVFRPERFLERKPSPYEFLPFGGGVRRCVGMAFALYEMKVVLARVLARTSLRLASSAQVAVVRRSVTLAPAGGVRVILDSRR
jgi:cytochrome P450